MQVTGMTRLLCLSVRVRFTLIFAVLWIVFTAGVSGAAGNAATFEIKTFELSGNSIYSGEKLQEQLKPFTGAEKTAADVEKARDALEKFYHESGYPAVLVNIPEQTIKDGVVKLVVVESRVGHVKISGNRFFTSEKMLRDLQSFNPGQMLYLPKVQEELGRVNRSQDIKVEPLMTPGSTPGTIDIELKVEDKLPLHGYLELNNRASQDTSDLRLNAMLRYDNLWQREHSFTLQYQTSPQNTAEVEAVSAAYVLPSPLDNDHQLVFFGVWSDSSTAFGEGFQVTGKGEIFGTRYAVPLPPYKLYAHNITLGLDYKDFKEDVGFTQENGETTHTPITYLPLSVAYSSVLQDSLGLTQFNAGLNMSFRGLISDQREFETKRYKGTAGYLYAKAGIQRNQKLPLGLGLLFKGEGQLSNAPLIANEEYVAGGMESVRGYKENEVAGDDAVYAKLELSFPDPLEKTATGKFLQASPFIFYDFAYLSIKEPLGGQTQSYRLEGAGAGLRGSLTKYLEYEMDWAFALSDAGNTQRDDYRFYFKLKAAF